MTEPAAEATLDPQDWERARALGHRMVDDVVAFLRDVRERPVWQSPPAATRSALREEIPWEAQGLEKTYDTFREHVWPYATGNVHPRFWGWVMGTGTLSAAYAEMLAAAMNSSVSIFDDGPTLVEAQVVRWLTELMGLPTDASGLLVSGGSMANVIALAAARNLKAGYDVRQLGVRGGTGPLTLYASRETHNSVTKGAELLGLGRDGLRLLPVDPQFRLDVRELKAAIAADRAEGRLPFCVVANAGTVNTGATDDLHAVARVCAREGLWMHVDGAFGALARLAPETRALVDGIERADSIAFDLHKWGYLPYEVGCTLVRDGARHKQAFALSASYLAAASGGLLRADGRFSDLGLQLSRGFRALKVWMAFKEHGVTTLGRLIAQNVAQARALADRVQREPELQLTAPAPLNVVCFRYVGDVPAERLDAHNERILRELHRSGFAAPSATHLNGHLSLRVANTNHRSRRADFEALVDEVLRLGRQSAAPALENAS
jgi:aromatic-L-amino-acid decarboxylase